LAVRVPDNFELRNLIKKTGPIVSTSANLRGQEPAKTVKEARKYFGDRLDFYVDAGHLDSQPSTLVKIENNKLKVVRQGAYEIKPQF
jgi:L-threonylcarbamoyladenylate synthase